MQTITLYLVNNQGEDLARAGNKIPSSAPGLGVWSGIIGQDSHIFARAGARIEENPSPIIHGAGNPDRFLIIFLLSENNCFM